MTNKTQNNFSDLDHFLNTNNPMPPAPKSGEKERILNNLMYSTQASEFDVFQKKSSRKVFKLIKWFVPIAATAVLAFFIITHKNITVTTNPQSTITDAELASYLEDSFEGLTQDYDSGDSTTVAYLSEQFNELSEYDND